MAESVERQINLAAVQRIDSYITAIVDNATQVALYKFSPDAKEWEKTEVEGTFFVYRRSVDPHHGFIIINRLSTTNLIEPITEDMEYQDQNPFLLYRNNKGSICCLWFYGEDNCARIAKLFKSLCRIAKKAKLHLNQKTVQKNDLRKKHASQGTDIMSLLTRAQNEYDKRSSSNQAIHVEAGRKLTSTSHKNGDIVKPTPLRANGVVHVASSLPLTVHNLFAQAGDSTNASTGDTPLRSRSASMVIHRELAREPSIENAEVILQRLLSNPAHTVEHIEKKQKDESFEKLKRTRSATFPEEIPDAPNALASVEIMEKDLKKKLNILPKTSTEERVQSSGRIIHSPNDSNGMQHTPTKSFADLPLLTPAMLEKPSILSHKCSTEIFSKCESSSIVQDSFSNAPYVSMPGIVSQSSPPLLSPMDFTVPARSITNKFVSGNTEPSVPLGDATSLGNGFRNYDTDCKQDLLSPQNLFDVAISNQMPSNVGITPLSKNQLGEALNFMLKNDDEFLTKIHQCYVKSLHNQLNKS